jgi:hypothetical protein
MPPFLCWMPLPVRPRRRTRPSAAGQAPLLSLEPRVPGRVPASVVRVEVDEAPVASTAPLYAQEERRRSLRVPACPEYTSSPYVLAAGGFQYTSGALAPDSGSPGDPEPVTRFEPRGRVGTRVPHCWLDPGRTRSTIDLAGPGWALLTTREPPPVSSPGLDVHQLSEADFLDSGECLLVRPDQIVAWRGTSPSAALTALRAILDAPPPGVQ